MIESEAEVLRMMFDAYTVQGLSINAIARQLNQRQIPTRTGATRWERSTVWGMLRNPAYQGKACFGKTEFAAAAAYHASVEAEESHAEPRQCQS